MQIPAKPADEANRIDTLRALKILDTSTEERFDRLTRLARRLFGVPIALVSLIDEDRQWFKSCFGLEASEMARDISFCGHAILQNDIFVIPDAALDGRFSDNPMVTGAPGALPLAELLLQLGKVFIEINHKAVVIRLTHLLDIIKHFDLEA